MNNYFDLDPPNTRFKILRLAAGTYLIAIACGEIDADGLARIFCKTSELCEALLDCKILIDLEGAKLTLEGSDVDALFRVLRKLAPRSV